jgi:hypothetical protein
LIGKHAPIDASFGLQIFEFLLQSGDIPVFTIYAKLLLMSDEILGRFELEFTMSINKVLLSSKVLLANLHFS